MLRHIAETSGVVVPVAAESAVGAVLVVRLPRCGTEPHIPVESARARLRLEVDAAGPEELPAEALPGAEHAAHRFAGIADEIVLHHLPDRFNGRPETVERILEAEPGVETEHALFRLHVFHDPLAFADRAGHRLFAPDVLAGARGHHAHDAVPVRRRADVDDIDGRIFQKFYEIGIRLHLAEAVLRGERKPFGNAQEIGVAKSHQPRTLVRKVVAALGDAAAADNGAGELVGRRFGAPEHLRRDYVERAERRAGLQQISS